MNFKLGRSIECETVIDNIDIKNQNMKRSWSSGQLILKFVCDIRTYNSRTK